MLNLRYYQDDAIEYFFRYTRENHGKHPLIVMPTGSGKSIVQAHIVKRMIDSPGTRVLLITHQQELIMQNHNELIDNLDGDMFIDIGIYSAGLNRRDTESRILFAGIQSVHGRALELGFFDMILVDEAHRINSTEAGTYRKFLKAEEEINPNIVIVGLSATPYRMKTGLLTEGKDALFDDICYECSITELINANHFRNRDKKQYLSNIISKNSVHKVDMDGVHIRGGEYVPGEMEKKFNVGDVVASAVNEIIELTHDRKKVLVFTAGIAHCESVYKEFLNHTNEVDYVHSKRTATENETSIDNFKSGRIKYLLNVDVLTTGFNEKAIDCIAIMRATMSPGLYSQIVGRGLRIAEGKIDCLVLDYGGNILRHGPIDKIEISMNQQTGKREVTTAPMKECPMCHSLIWLSARQCLDCGYEFPENDKHEKTASEEDILSRWKKPETMEVFDVIYRRHDKVGKPPSVRVDYKVGAITSYSEWVCIEHGGFARKKAEKWLKERTDQEIKTVDFFLEVCHGFRKPEKIIVDENGKFPSVIGYVFKDKEQELNERIAALI